ncbi:putative ABC transporter ATP-binding protein [Oligella sp. MSHR50489EDL]|uniref:ABC transporter ATP-binding protein n=1 Tax=Oligella sp. MSHR50489EDL TaxID=3139409 RepID=UPI003D812868
MNQYFKKRFALSDQGVQSLKKSIFSHTLVNLSRLLPPMVGLLFVWQYLGETHRFSSPLQLTLTHYLVLIAVCLVLMLLLNRWDYTALYLGVYNESARNRIAVGNRLKQLPLSYFQQRDVSDLSATVMSDMELYDLIFSHAVPQFYATIISTCIISVMLLSHHLWMGVAALWVIPVAILVFMLSKRAQKRQYIDSVAAGRQVHEALQSTLDQMADIKAYHQEEQVMAWIAQRLSESTRIKQKAELLTSVGIGFSVIILKLGLVSVAVVGLQLWLTGDIELITYIAYLLLAGSLYLPIEGVLGFLVMLLLLDAVVARIKEIKTMPIQTGRTEMRPKNFDLVFEDVFFGYDTHSVINGVNFVAKQGQITALIGPSGSGKTTLAKLAARFWDIQGGRILLGGEDISQVDPETLLQHFSIVFQEVILFNASIKDNIRVGNKNASDDAILQAAKVARCDELIARMPDGIDTVIGENGVRLSGGERQRISIARAILKDAPIVLLDEMTASLDFENEALIQAALKDLIKDKTVLVIAHRMHTIQQADQIILLHHGKVEAKGDDRYLREHSPLYQRFLM